MSRRAKILATLGPASSTKPAIEALIANGVDAVRLNFSHGSHDDHRELFHLVRLCAQEQKRPIAIVQDLQGPKIRIGKLEAPVELEEGKALTIVCTDGEHAKDQIPCTYLDLWRDVDVGHALLLDDGRLELKVIAIAPKIIHCEIVTGGPLSSNKGINLPGAKLSIPSLTDKDLKDLAFGQTLGVDYVALSFVRSADDIHAARALCGKTPLIAKIEKPEAIEQIEEIVDAADGIMIARGDLGVEMGPEQVPLLQKRLIELANWNGKLVITATEMLDSMRHNPRPTRAEASDVANAVLDGTDALMLSGETASGKYPRLTVRTMGRIISETESSSRYRTLADRARIDLGDQDSCTNALARAAVVAARDIKAKLIVCFTETGTIAQLLSEYRPPMPILATTLNEPVFHRLALYWGVLPVLLEHNAPTADDVLHTMRDAVLHSGLAQPGDFVILTIGSRERGSDDLIKISRL